MKTLRFSGHSDDTFGEYAVFHDDHDDCAHRTIRVWEVRSGEHVLHVCGQYAPDNTPGCWLVGVQTDDVRPLPPWHIWFEPSGMAYSPMLCVEVPDDATMTLIRR